MILTKPFNKLLGFAALLTMLVFSVSAQAAISVSWTSPADGSVFPVGTSVSPTGQANAFGSTGTGLDLVLVLDSSGSMTLLETVGSVTQSRAQWQKDAAIALVNSLPTVEVSVGVVEFDSDANTVRLLTPLSTNKADVIAGINSVDASGGTTIGTGIVEATNVLTGPSHTLGRSQQMIVFSDGSTSGSPSTDAANAVAAGVDNVHSVALPGAVISTMQGIASSGNGTFFDASTVQGLQDLIDLFSGAGGSLVGVDRVDITLPDGTFVASVPVDALGNFTSPAFNLAAGANVFLATAYDTLGNSASATLTLIGRDASVPEPGILGLLGLGLIGMAGLRRRKV